MESLLLAVWLGGVCRKPSLSEDVAPSGEQWEVTSAPSDLPAVRAALEDAGVRIDEAEVTQLPSTTVPLGPDAARRVLRIVDALDDLDDVQAVYANFDISEEVLAEV